ncbi:MAG: cytochrome [Pseudonocardiales bacterium]|nr:cytochrome [Pseudonocardiales bacterium]
MSWLAVLDGWLVTRHDLATETMRDAATFTVDDPRFSTAQVVGPSMLSLDGPEHARHRAPFVQAFRPAEARARFAAVAAAAAEGLVAEMARAGSGELRRDLAGPLAVAVIADALGLVGVETATVLAWYDAIVAAVSAITAGQDPAGGAEAFDRLSGSVEATIGAGDASSLLVAAAGALSVPEVVSNAAVLMFGAIETTEGMIANAMLHLLANPRQLADVRAGTVTVPAAVEESLRLEPAAAVVDRYATRDVTLGGAPIARGELVRVSIAGANRDPAVFAEPNTFDVHRANNRLQLAFAVGPHFCIGRDLARLEADVAVSTLLRELPGIRLVRPSTPRGLVFRKPAAVHVAW